MLKTTGTGMPSTGAARGLRPGWGSASAALGALSLVTLAQTAGGAPAPDGAALLARAAEATRTVDYQGMLVYRAGADMDSMRIVHRYKNGQETERLSAVNGTTREVLRRGNTVTWVLPRDVDTPGGPPNIKTLFSGMTPQRIQSLSAFYNFRTGPTTRIAGRLCQGLLIVPRDQYRYGYELWLDQDTGLPLKLSLIANGPRVLEEVMFSEIRFPPGIPDAAFELPRASAGVRQMTVSDRAAAEAPMVATPEGLRLPPGFRVVARDSQPLDGGAGRLDHLLISDGLTSVSLFSGTVSASDRPVVGMSQLGAVHAYGRVVEGRSVTVVGEAPPDTVRSIGDSAPAQLAPGAANGGSPPEP